MPKVDVKQLMLTDEQIEKLEQRGPLGPAMRLLYDNARQVIEEVLEDEDVDREHSLRLMISYTIAIVVLIQAAPTIAGAGVVMTPEDFDGNILGLDEDDETLH